jgi:lipopolysaccharide biosynthesis glycosyltransferase
VDNDILFFADISVDAIELDGFPVAAVHDIAEVGGITDAAFLKNCDANHRSRHYFNSGFMLYDSDKWMEASLRAGYMAHLDSHQHYCEYKNPCATNDQCVFNRLFENNWKRLPLDYNFQACAKFTDRWNSASVKHYQGMPKFIPMRPWRLDRRDVRLIRKIRRLLGYRDFGLPYLGISYFLNTIRNHAKINRVESAISAVECLSPQAGSVHGSAV